MAFGRGNGTNPGTTQTRRAQKARERRQPVGTGADYEAREGARTGSDVREVSRQTWGKTEAEADGKGVLCGDSIRAEQ